MTAERIVTRSQLPLPSLTELFFHASCNKVSLFAVGTQAESLCAPVARGTATAAISEPTESTFAHRTPCNAP
jgi:hypothetical protein